MTKYEYKWVPSGEPILNINSKDGWRFVAFDATVQSGTQWVLMERPIPDSDTAQAEAAPSEREKRLAWLLNVAYKAVTDESDHDTLLPDGWYAEVEKELES